MMYSKKLLAVNFLNSIFLLINFAKANVPQELTITIHDHDEYIKVTLKEVSNSYLVNNQLPVWKMVNDELQPYKKLNVMSALGTTTAYFNNEDKAALIYSSNCQCLNGVIGVKYIIKNLPIYHIHTVQTIDGDHITLRNLRSAKPLNLASKTSPYTEEELKRNERALDKVLYPEILIVIKHDFYSNWEDTSTRNENIILYIISLMNAADMFYAVEDTFQVRLNIAGIIIESEPNILPSIPDYHDSEYLPILSLIHEVANSNYSYFKKFKLNPRMSIDWIFFITNKSLSRSKEVNLKRMSSYPKMGIVQSRLKKCDGSNTPISIITDDYNFGSFPRISHEVLHLINHGSQTQRESVNCHLEFLDEFDVSNFETFQWSDDCCLLTNEPQSLNFAQTPLDPKRQCQCYGYVKNYENQSTTCTELLTCEDAHKNEHVLPRIVDDIACRNKWETEKKNFEALLTTTTTTPVPSITFEENWSPMEAKNLLDIMFVFPSKKKNSSDDDDGLKCFAVVVGGDDLENQKLAVTAASCKENSLILRSYLFQKERGKIIIRAQADADYPVLTELLDTAHDIAVSYSSELSESEFGRSKIQTFSKITDLGTIQNQECRLIDFQRVNDPRHPFIIRYIPINVSVQKTTGSSNSVIRSNNQIKKSDLQGLMGNPLFCSSDLKKANLVGILVEHDDDKHLRFVSLGDYESVLQNKMNLLLSSK